jgi:hypothetical protein
MEVGHPAPPDLGHVNWLFFYYQNQRVIQKLQRKIGWLEQMLKNVHREAESMRKASIDESLQLRVDILGDEGGPHARVKDRNEGKTLGEILQDALRVS